MRRLTYLLRIVAVLQIVLGFGFLLFPGTLLQAMGHSLPQMDIYYPLGMLASRFIAYGIALFLISRTAAQHVLWIKCMVWIQLIDLSVGIYYTATGVLSLSLSAFPMFNATWIIILLILWQPTKKQVAPR